MRMEDDGQNVEQVLCMNGGESKTSYTKNSHVQRNVMSSTRHILEDSVIDVCNTFCSSNSIAVADLGCATGPNALLAATNIFDIVCKTCDDMGHKIPSFIVYLNDLPSNDFNTIFRSLADFGGPFSRVGRDQCFVMAVPGSFHGRLFPCNSLNFVHSSYALHWLSKVPKGLIGKNGEGLNKGNIYIGESSSLAVQTAHAEQFKEDFYAFLRSRSEELQHGGSMLLTFIGNFRSNAPFKMHEVISQTLVEMANEDLLEESNLDSFNMPFHAASGDQISEAIIKEGSFNICKLEAFNTNWNAGMDAMDGGTGECVAKHLRAVLEPLLVAAFGEGIMDELFKRAGLKYEELMNINAGDCHYHNFVIWLKRK